MNHQNKYFILPLLGYPALTIPTIINVFINNDLDTVYVECSNKSVQDLDYFYHDNTIIYIIPITDKRVKHFVKLMYEGEWKKLLELYPDLIEVINLTSGLAYYKVIKDTPKMTQHQTHRMLLMLNRTDDAYRLLSKEYEAFGEVLDKEAEYLPPMKEEEMNYISTRISNLYQQKIIKFNETLYKRNQYKITNI